MVASKALLATSLLLTGVLARGRVAQDPLAATARANRHDVPTVISINSDASTSVPGDRVTVHLDFSPNNYMLPLNASAVREQYQFTLDLLDALAATHPEMGSWHARAPKTTAVNPRNYGDKLIGGVDVVEEDLEAMFTSASIDVDFTSVAAHAAFRRGLAVPETVSYTEWKLSEEALRQARKGLRKDVVANARAATQDYVDVFGLPEGSARLIELEEQWSDNGYVERWDREDDESEEGVPVKLSLSAKATFEM